MVVVSLQFCRSNPGTHYKLAVESVKEIFKGSMGLDDRSSLAGHLNAVGRETNVAYTWCEDEVLQHYLAQYPLFLKARFGYLVGSEINDDFKHLITSVFFKPCIEIRSLI